jgi:hypothetical protein
MLDDVSQHRLPPGTLSDRTPVAMGVGDLWKFLKDAGHKVDLQTLAGKVRTPRSN